MEIVAKVILFAAIVFVIVMIGSIRARVCDDDDSTFIPVLIIFLGIFVAFIVSVVTSGISFFHLLWMFPASIVIAFLMLLIPFTAAFPALVVVLLRKTKRSKS